MYTEDIANAGEGNEINIDIDPDVDISTEEGQFKASKIMAFVSGAAILATPGIVAGVKYLMRNKGLTKAIDKLESEILHKNVLSMTEEELRTEFNEDLRKMGHAIALSDQYTKALESLNQNTTKEEAKVQEYLLNTQLDFYNKYAPLGYSESMQSNIDALNGPIEKGRPKILQTELMDSKFFINRMNSLLGDLKQMLKNKVDTIKNMTVDTIKETLAPLDSRNISQNLNKLFQQLDELKQHPEKIIDINKFEPFIKLKESTKKRIKEFNPFEGIDYNDSQLVQKTKSLIEQMGLDVNDFDNQLIQLENKMKISETAPRMKKIFTNTLEQFKDEFKGMNLDEIGTDIVQFERYMKSHPELKEVAQKIREQFYTKFRQIQQNELKPLLNSLKNQLITEQLNMIDQNDFSKLIEKYPSIEKLQDMLQNAPNYFKGDLARMEQKITENIKKSALGLWNDITKEATNAFDLKTFLNNGNAFGLIQNILGPEAQDVIKKTNQIATEFKDSAWSIAKQLSEKFPELKKELTSALSTGKISEELKGTIGNSDLGKLFQEAINKPADLVSNVLLDKIKKDQLARYEAKPESFIQLQLPESEKYNFDFVNATPEEKDELIRIYTTKGLFNKLIKERKLSPSLINNAQAQSEEINNIYTRAQRLRSEVNSYKNNPDLAKHNLIKKYTTRKERGVLPILDPFLKNANVKNKSELINKVKTSKSPLFEEQIMLYNLNGNDPELYMSTERSLKNRLVKNIERTTGVVAEKLLDNSEQMITDLAHGNYKELAQNLEKTTKDALKQEAQYYLLTSALNIQETPIVVKYLSDKYPKQYFDLRNKDSIFQNTSIFEKVAQAQKQMEEWNKDIEYLKRRGYTKNNTIFYDKDEIDQIYQNLKPSYKKFNYSTGYGGHYSYQYAENRNKFKQILDQYDKDLVEQAGGYNITQEQKRDMISILEKSIDDLRSFMNHFTQQPTEQQEIRNIVEYRNGPSFGQGHFPENLKQVSVDQLDNAINKYIEQNELELSDYEQDLLYANNNWNSTIKAALDDFAVKNQLNQEIQDYFKDKQYYMNSEEYNQAYQSEKEKHLSEYQKLQQEYNDQLQSQYNYATKRGQAIQQEYDQAIDGIQKEYNKQYMNLSQNKERLIQQYPEYTNQFDEQFTKDLENLNQTTQQEIQKAQSKRDLQTERQLQEIQQQGDQFKLDYNRKLSYIDNKIKQDIYRPMFEDLVYEFIEQRQPQIKKALDKSMERQIIDDLYVNPITQDIKNRWNELAIVKDPKLKQLSEDLHQLDQMTVQQIYSEDTPKRLQDLDKQIQELRSLKGSGKDTTDRKLLKLREQMNQIEESRQIQRYLDQQLKELIDRQEQAFNRDFEYGNYPEQDFSEQPLEYRVLSQKVPAEITRIQEQELLEPSPMTFKETKYPLVKNPVKEDQQLTKQLENLYKQTKEKLSKSNSVDQSQVIKEYNTERQKILSDYMPQTEIQMKLKDIPRAESYIQDLYNSFYRRAVNRQTTERSLIKEYGDDLQRLDQDIQTLLNQQISDQNIDEYNKLLKKLYKDKYKQVPENNKLIPKRQKKQSWKEYADEHHFDYTLPQKQDTGYNAYRNTFELTTGNKAKNYIIDRIINSSGKYDYDQSLIENYQNLSVQDKYNVVKDGLPDKQIGDDEYKKFYDWFQFNNDTRDKVFDQYRSLPRILYQMLSQRGIIQ